MKKTWMDRFLLGAIYLLFIAAIFLFSYRLAGFLDKHIGAVAYFFILAVLFSLSFFLMIAFHVFIHEWGHMFFGKRHGYRLIFFRFFNWVWEREKGKLRYLPAQFPGAIGQCLMAPPRNGGNIKGALSYLAGGVKMNAIMSGLGLVSLFFIPFSSLQWSLIFLFSIVGLYFVGENRLPVIEYNDGSHMREIETCPGALEDFHRTLALMEDLVVNGRRVSEIPPQNLEPMCACEDSIKRSGLEQLKAYGLLVRGHTQEAVNLYQILMSRRKGRNDLLTINIKIDLISALLLSGRYDEAEKEDTLAVRKMMKKMKHTPSVLRTRYLWALLKDGDEEAARRCRELFEKKPKTYIMRGEVLDEKTLLDRAWAIYEKKKAQKNMCCQTNG